jgi:hypothetical protein
MSKQSILITEIPLAQENRVLRIEAVYAKGGVSYFTGNNYPRGFYASLAPITKLEGNGFSTILGSGGRVFMAPAARFSAKGLEAAAAQIKAALANSESSLALDVAFIIAKENAKAPATGAAALMAA